MRTARPICLTEVLFLLAIHHTTAGAFEGSGATIGDTRLPSGPRATYDYHFDHNAFADSVDVPGGLIALTRSGNLLRFDPGTRKRDREWFGPSRVTCLGRGGGDSVLVGFEDGRIARLDPVSLARTAVATVPGKPQWVGARRDGGIVVVVERHRWVDPQLERIEYDKLIKEMGFKEFRGNDVPGQLPPMAWEPFSEVRELESGRAFAVHKLASSFFIDGKDRVWLGSQENGFGGWSRCIDLAAGRPRPIRGNREPTDWFQGMYGVETYGFFETGDGQVWAYGGTQHEISSASIARLDGPRVAGLFHCEQPNPFVDEDKRRQRPDRPDQVIQRITEGLEPGSLLVFAEDEEKQTIFRTDATLKPWSKLLTLDLRWSSNLRLGRDRPPVVRAVHRRPGTGELILATEKDGYVRAADGRRVFDLASDQLEADEITTIIASPEATYFQGWDLGSPWQYRDGQWGRAPLHQVDRPDLDRCRIMAGPSGTIDVVCDDFTARRRGGKAEFTLDKAPPEPIRSFVTSEGSLWSVSKGWQEEDPCRLHRFDGARWIEMSQFRGGHTLGDRVDYLDEGEWRTLSRFGWETREKKRPDGIPCSVPDPKRWELGDDLRVVNDAGPPWVVHDRDMGRLMVLSHGPEFANARLAPLSVEDGGLPLSVDDAISWSREEILIATRKGLKLCHVTTGKLRAAPLPAADRPVRRLARDGMGRLWMGGDGLWMADLNGRLHDLASVPMVGQSAVAALSADPGRRDGMIVSLGIRGVAFIKVDPAP